MRRVVLGHVSDISSDNPYHELCFQGHVSDISSDNPYHELCLAMSLTSPVTIHTMSCAWPCLWHLQWQSIPWVVLGHVSDISSELCLAMSLTSPVSCAWPCLWHLQWVVLGHVSDISSELCLAMSLTSPVTIHTMCFFSLFVYPSHADTHVECVSSNGIYNWSAVLSGGVK